jgi:tryptophan synthase alpha chain
MKAMLKHLANKVDLIIIGSALVDTFFNKGMNATLEKITVFRKY